MLLKTMRTLLFGLGLLLPPVAQAQTNLSTRQEVGLPYLTCFSPKGYGGGNQDWSFAQDSRGMIYVGDNLGVLEYDGASWRLILTATNNVVRSLGVGDDDTVYVGSATDFGYLAPDETGMLAYVSLFEYIPEDDRAFNDIWTVLPTPGGIYFQARERLFRFTRDGDGWAVKVWRPEGVFYYAFWLDDTYYVHQGGVGLMKMVDDELELLPGGEQFSGERLHVFLPYERRTSGADLYLVGTFNRGLFLFDGQAFTPFETEADDLLVNATIYKGAVLPGETYGLALIDGGLLVIDREGKVVVP